MKQTRDLAVRMRPRVPRDGLVPGHDTSARPDAAARPRTPSDIAASAMAATQGQTPCAKDLPSTPPAGGFSARSEEARIPARSPFMPNSRDLAAQDSPDPEAPARSSSDSNARPSVPRRQIWDFDQDDGASARAAEPRARAPRIPVPSPAQQPATRPEIPDDEARAATPPEADAGGDDMASRARRALAAAERTAEERGLDPAALAVDAPEDGGAKTRVLGFHAPSLETDPISAVARKSAHDVMFPAGWLVVVDGPGRGAFFAVSDSVSSVGRGTDQTICLNFGDASVSRQNHAAIAYDAEQNRFFLGHGNKSNIVRRNGQPVLSTEELSDGDVIRIGKTSLRFVALCGPDFTWDHTEDGEGGHD